MEQVAVTAKQKGEVGEALLKGHIRETSEIIEPWLTSALGDHLPAAQEASIQITHEPRIETFYVYFDGEHMSWTPDLQYTARVAKSFGPLQSSNDQRIEVPIEVKTGAYAELERNQRTVMELLSTDPSCFPVVATIELSGLPAEFGVEFDSVVDPVN